jgi:prepilin-type N-terminal cleavage/methylation domain-containing protein/prepilin-type processing-associated H-X9-DG protein
MNRKHVAIAVAGSCSQGLIPRLRTKRGFTLVEQLVTITIIAILAALLLAVLSSARLRAQQLHCLNNVRQLGTIGFIYSDENGKHPAYLGPKYAGSPLTTRTDNMGRFTISRHGGIRPAGAPRHLTAGARLPGAINIVFADGHAKSVPLEQLWTLTWHFDWQVPAVRPQNPR